MKLIDKDALVAEIENIRKHYIERDDFDNGWNFALDKILSFIDTLEVKEVDLKKETDNEDPICTCEECLLKSFKAGAEWQEGKDDGRLKEIEL